MSRPSLEKNNVLLKSYSGPSTGLKKWGGGVAAMPKNCHGEGDELPLKGIICKKVGDHGTPVVGGPGVPSIFDGRCLHPGVPSIFDGRFITPLCKIFLTYRRGILKT